MIKKIQLHTRARRCICISISCGCYQPSGSVYRQPLPSSYRQPVYRQQPDTATPCVTNCIQSCMQNQYNSCQQSCQNSCGTQRTYQLPREIISAPYQYESIITHEVSNGQQSGTQAAYQQPKGVITAPYQYESVMTHEVSNGQQSGTQAAYQQPKGIISAPYQYESVMTHEVSNGQQSLTGTCINICMPGCEMQCIQRSTPVPVVQRQPPVPVPVVQSQTPSYYPPQQQQYEPVVQQYSNNDNTLCIHLCMPSCESQCIERTTPAIPPPPYPAQTEQPYPSKLIPYQSSSNQTSIVVRPNASGTVATICLPVCMPACQSQCTENSGQRIGGSDLNGGTTPESGVPTQSDLQIHEISINLPQSIQQSPNCIHLCQETCMQQCVEQNQPAEQCQPSCSSTCQESCPQTPVSVGTTNSNQPLQTESEIYEKMPQTLDNSMNSNRLKTFLLRSPPYYRQPSSYESQVTNCLTDSSSGIGQCNCSSGYVPCLSTNSRISQQRCCRKRR
ncbi:unnamed protein product [Onchocerca ochengi]|uniref:Protein kinase domain-containing protein n=1 Tax=Onchocerca ochengi TaxID=42157 RepID=A0A182EJX6_ONCOC|nr:unnamed protein product [Onchocerca ochengi]